MTHQAFCQSSMVAHARTHAHARTRAHHSVLGVGLLVVHFSDLLFGGAVNLTQHAEPLAVTMETASAASRVRRHKRGAVVACSSPGVFRRLGDQVVRPVGHHDVEAVLLPGDVDDLSAGHQKSLTFRLTPPLRADIRAGDLSYLAACMSSAPFILSSLSFSKYMSLLCRSTNQRRFQLRRDSVDEPPPFLCSQPCFKASCLARNHRKVSSLRTHQRRFQVFIRPPVEERRCAEARRRAAARGAERCQTFHVEEAVEVRQGHAAVDRVAPIRELVVRVEPVQVVLAVLELEEDKLG